MKILVLQLARLGDIYQTWPVLRALKRQNPKAEVHLLTRSKFAGAAPWAPTVDRHWLLDTRDILTPLIDERPDLEASSEKTSKFAEDLKQAQFDVIINLSFSPFSSYLTGEIATERTQVKGYTRFSDGYLSIPDDGSAFFYAQVGVGRSNRVHVTDLFAHVAGVDLNEDDWVVPPVPDRDLSDLPRVAHDAIVIHVGASDLRKTFSWSKWLQIVKGLCEAYHGPVVLIGSAEEAELNEKISAVTSGRPPVNLAGRTDLREVFEIVRNAKLLIGGDSAPVHIASITNTPVLNISLPLVNFWETGPRSARSRILAIESEDAISSDAVVGEAIAILAGRMTELPVVRVPGRGFPYVETRVQKRGFEWELIRAIYMGEAFPAPPHELFLQAMQRLNEVNHLALEQIETLKRLPGNKTAASILDRVDEIMEQITKMVPECEPLVQWFRTERLRIGPMPVARLVVATETVHKNLANVIALYHDPGQVPQEETGDDDVKLG